MRKTTLAVMISSVLLGAVAAHAEPGADPSSNQQAQATPQTDTSRPSATSTAPDADTATGTSTAGSAGSGNVDVGAARSNADKDSSSGSYYPYSAGTAGDDPAKPTSTSVPADTNDPTPEPTDQWMDPAADADGDGYLSKDEVAKVAPALMPSFGEMDVDGDQKLTRAEYRNWNESHKARMESDQGANPASNSQRSDTTSPGSTSTSSDGTSPDSKTGN